MYNERAPSNVKDKDIDLICTIAQVYRGFSKPVAIGPIRRYLVIFVGLEDAVRNTVYRKVRTHSFDNRMFGT